MGDDIRCEPTADAYNEKVQKGAVEGTLRMIYSTEVLGVLRIMDESKREDGTFPTGTKKYYEEKMGQWDGKTWAPVWNGKIQKDFECNERDEVCKITCRGKPNEAKNRIFSTQETFKKVTDNPDYKALLSDDKIVTGRGGIPSQAIELHRRLHADYPGCVWPSARALACLRADISVPLPETSVPEQDGDELPPTPVKTPFGHTGDSVASMGTPRTAAAKGTRQAGTLRASSRKRSVIQLPNVASMSKSKKKKISELLDQADKATVERSGKTVEDILRSQELTQGNFGRNPR